MMKSTHMTKWLQSGKKISFVTILQATRVNGEALFSLCVKGVARLRLIRSFLLPISLKAMIERVDTFLTVWLDDPFIY